MLEKSTLLEDPQRDTTEPPRHFRFDHSYWSHDGFKVTEDGYLEPHTTKYIDQRRLLEELGGGLLHNAWSGYNCTLFAYGQTGSGKSYSMMGYGANKGIIPMLCEKLFEDIAAQGKHPNIIYQVSISMMEIYNEKVRDLLNKRQQPTQGLPVRERRSDGFYVEGLTTLPVADYRDIEHLIEEGSKSRTLAATKLNETSSRAHTIVTIHFTQTFLRDNRTKRSQIYMVDLAGSERASQTGATGVRFTESKKINKSLMTLGSVIKNLCAVASGRRDQGPCPYRDSKLTMLLKDAIGGNSKTVMVATISPSDEDYEQTLSTLRYADRVKSIKNAAKMNVAATDKLVKELLAEKEALLAKLKQRPDSRLGYTQQEIQRLRDDQMNEIEQIKREMMNAESAWQTRLQETKLHMEQQLESERKEKKERAELPHLWNLNEDPTLTGKVYHVIRPGQPVTVGNSRAVLTPTIELHGPSIAKEHAVLHNKKSNVTLHPLQGQVKVNGITVTNQTQLKHQDRIFFSSNNLFVFHHPTEELRIKASGRKMKAITFGMAQNEIGRNSNVSTMDDQGWLKQEIADTLTRTQDANAMAAEMKKDVTFEPIVIAKLVLGQDVKRAQVYVKVCTGNGGEFIWGEHHFLDRFDLMMDMFQKFENGDPSWEAKTLSHDPFWEPLETPTLVGVAYVPLECIAYMLDIEDQKIGIFDYQANHVGYLNVSLVPCTNDGEECAEELAVEEPIDMLEQTITFKVKIKGATGIPKRFKSSWCHYTFYTEQTRVFTDEVIGIVPKYHFEHTHTLPQLTQQMIEHLEEKSIMVELYGRQRGNTNRRGSTLNAYTLMSDKRRLSNYSVANSVANYNVANNVANYGVINTEVKQPHPSHDLSHDSSGSSSDSNIGGAESASGDTEGGWLETVQPFINERDASSDIVTHMNLRDNLHERRSEMSRDGGGIFSGMRKGISSMVNKVLMQTDTTGDATATQQVMASATTLAKEPPTSNIAANTKLHTVINAFESSGRELDESKRKLEKANRKLDEVHLFVHSRQDEVSIAIKKILRN